MGGNGQTSTSSRLFVSDAGNEVGRDFIGSDNVDHGSDEFDSRGLKNWKKGEYKRAQAGVIEYLRGKRLDVGSYAYVPIETDPSGGSYGYTVKVTGAGIYDFLIVGRVRLI